MVSRELKEVMAMKRLVMMISLFAMFSLAPLFASAAEIREGDTTTVPEIMSVIVKNLEPIGNGSFRYGDQCNIKHGAKVTVVGIDGNRVLVRYSLAEYNSHAGSSCMHGVLFFVTKAEFLGMSAKHAATSGEKKIIKQLLKNEKNER